jgi:predicted O-methyltransferase YrrM
MPLFDKLLGAYEAEGFRIATGLNSTMYRDLFTAPFTRLVRDGESLTDGYGISLQELWFLEVLGTVKPASSILVIGNSFGWSTLALALVYEGGRVLALDAGVDDYSLEGIALTNMLAQRLGVNAFAVEGSSPGDVPRALSDAAMGPLDVVLVDGLHTHAQLVADWHAVLPFMRSDGLVLCHDVLLLQLERTFSGISMTPGWTGIVLHATTSGIGVLYTEQPRHVLQFLRALAVDESARAAVSRESTAGHDVPGFERWQDAAREYHAAHSPPASLET